MMRQTTPPSASASKSSSFHSPDGREHCLDQALRVSRHQLLDPEYLDITRFNVFALLCDSDRIIIHQSNFT